MATRTSDPGKNPRTLVYDPDFRAINDPEWSAQILSRRLDRGRADARWVARTSRERVWEYMLADADAKAWLDGKADPWGMMVNPCYSTKAAVPPPRCPTRRRRLSELPRDDFPKADPIEKAGHDRSATRTTAAARSTWSPSVPTPAASPTAAYRVLRGDGMILGGWDADRASRRSSARSSANWSAASKVIALTSTPAAHVYQTATALLRNPAGKFVGPDRRAACWQPRPP